MWVLILYSLISFAIGFALANLHLNIWGVLAFVVAGLIFIQVGYFSGIMISYGHHL